MLKFTISTLSAIALADKASIDKQLLAAVQNSSLRAFSGQIANAVDRLNEYGCWCYFYDNVGRGKGTPVDEIDGFCKTLADGYQCAMIDAESEGESCIPWEVDYQPGTGQGPERYSQCLANNADNTCAARACSVEGIFVDNLFAYLVSGTQINYETYGHNEEFDDPTKVPFNPAVDEGCPVKPGVKGVSGEKACCGAYPNRFPYKTLDGDRACCGARTYNTQLLNCCANGQVKANC